MRRILPTVVWVVFAAVCFDTALLFADEATPRRNGFFRRLTDPFRFADEHERSHPRVKSAFRDVVSPASASTVRVLAHAERQVALGAVVRADGYILTKASELEGELKCLLPDNRRVKAQLVAVDDTSDLALLHINVEDLPVVQWSDSTAPPVGSWLATVGLSEVPTAIGVVSAQPRVIPKPKPALGVGLEDSEEGTRVGRVWDDSPAKDAGLKSGDLIVGIGEQKTPNRDLLINAIGRRRPGERVVLSVKREGNSLSITATLTEWSRLGNPHQADLMEKLGGPLSERRNDFPQVLQHDSVLRPRDCGGPIVDLDGKVVGINIARASRVASFALPTHHVQSVLDDLFKKSVERVAQDASEPLEPVSMEQ